MWIARDGGKRSGIRLQEELPITGRSRISWLKIRFDAQVVWVVKFRIQNKLGAARK